MQQKMAPLPPERTEEHRPCVNIGIDCFGPLHVKCGRGSAKRWGYLFTCLTTRAVYLEVTHSLSADSFIMAFQRFVARRGKPVKMWSDNGTNFTVGEKELRTEFAKLNARQVEELMLLEAIDWKKRILKAIVNSKLLTDEELKSYFCEVEKIMNYRPLAKASDDPKDQEPLTPSHILLLRKNDCQAMSNCNNVIRKRWQLVQEVANQFHKLFCKEYLPTLQSRTRWRRIQQNLKVGDIVLILQESSPRGR